MHGKHGDLSSRKCPSTPKRDLLLPSDIFTSGVMFLTNMIKGVNGIDEYQEDINRLRDAVGIFHYSDPATALK